MLKLFNRKKKDNKGFTLVELVIVIAILAILVGLLAPQYTKYVEKSRKAADASNMDEMVRAVQIWAADADTADEDLPAKDYTIELKAKGEVASSVTIGTVDVIAKTIPDYKKMKLKSSKWESDTKGTMATSVKATVTYEPKSFADYMNTTNTTK